MKLRYIWPLLLVLAILLFLLTSTTILLPEGELIASSTSPNGMYQVNAYLCNGGATVDQAIRAEVVTVSTGSKRNIYWKYHDYDAEIVWISDEIVSVNSITLNVLSDTYDYRKE